MPQLDFHNPLTISQVVWMFIIFAALYAALRYWALPQMGGVLEMREQRISTDLASARTAKEEADRAATEIAERGRSASAEAQAQVAKASDAAKREAAEQARVDGEQLDRQLAEAEQRISAARKEAMGALRQVATDTAAAVVSRLTGQVPDSARIDAAVGDIMSRGGADDGALAARS
ncbi:MAG: F0F1 ATP synthase subunit B [Pseudomonadota bacterium]|nr:F0F1 ATP synthase subunit B [Pseudomonadota bacterium]